MSTRQSTTEGSGGGPKRATHPLPETPSEQKHPLSEGRDDRDTRCWREHEPGTLCLRPEGHAPVSSEQEVEGGERLDEGELAGIEARAKKPTPGGMNSPWEDWYALDVPRLLADLQAAREENERLSRQSERRFHQKEALDVENEKLREEIREARATIADLNDSTDYQVIKLEEEIGRLRQGLMQHHDPPESSRLCALCDSLASPAPDTEGNDG